MPTSLAYLLDKLNDPFSYFPIQSVSRSLQALVENTDEDLLNRMGSYGVSRKYWDAPSEILHEEIGLLIGANFVLGQAMITQTVSILNKIRELAPQTCELPNGKGQILSFQASKHMGSGLSHPCIVDLGANYFKHHSEWPEQWTQSGGSGLQGKTIQGCVAIGMSPREVTDNMFAALQALSADGKNVEAIQGSIEFWRNGLAKHLYEKLEITDPSTL
ncbi:hypothetical protein [Janthinobacterium sp. PAMC25594]|uniref:hypothetical protein n=1 Tax=Janthinobacterium sp. PAMC25594 TaxID=2861284 RepID=UPI001C6356C2|nr:hypothetical protein [Janthinobacterium sp. PAMC25594]QYG05210.1 hypothetical protein KY494_17780 [Janthinobacterium sp. PAMC25594]